MSDEKAEEIIRDYYDNAVDLDKAFEMLRALKEVGYTIKLTNRQLQDGSFSVSIYCAKVVGK